MTGLWQLPQTVELAGQNYPIYSDFRDILEIIGYLDDLSLPEFIRWDIALHLFYKTPVPESLTGQALEKMADFIRCGAQETPGPKLLDWQQDASMIISDVNKVAGQELRAVAYLHWWTFLGWFHAIGQGQLSTVVAIRDKLRRGKKLETWEQEFYRQNKEKVRLQPKLSAQEQAEKDRLCKLLDGG